jgi:hypothetical protein
MARRLFFNLKRPDWALIEVPISVAFDAALTIGVAPFLWRSGF